MYITKSTFLAKFQPPYTNDSFDSFVMHATVQSGKSKYPLRAYKNLSQAHMQLLYHLFVTERNDYLSRFYDKSLNFHYLPITTPPDRNAYSNNTHKQYKSIIRNMHYKEILEHTTSGIENTPSFLKVIRNAFKHWIIDYKLVTPSGLHYLKNGALGSILSGFYFRASIMNPYLVYNLHETLLHGTRIFTPTLGWSSYAYGFLESPRVTTYVGTDVIPSVCAKTAEFARMYHPQKTTRIFCKPSEDLAKDRAFRKTYKAYFDTVFFSPPYFKLETYPGAAQSTSRYGDYDTWLQKYWKATMELCAHVLRKRGTLCYILSGYGSKEKGKFVDLIADMKHITTKIFTFVREIQLGNTNVGVTKHRNYSESILLFQAR